MSSSLSLSLSSSTKALVKEEEEEEECQQEQQQNQQNEIIRPFEWLTSPLSLRPLFDEYNVINKIPNKRALHIGCGSSTVSTDLLIDIYNFNKVVDLDKDFETIEKMKMKKKLTTRLLLREQQQQNQQLQQQQQEQQHEFCICDFTKQNIPFESNYFGLILDKSTLDCTLCSDKATAIMLTEIYRLLSVGGIYLLISFHDIDLLRPLIQNMPYTNFDIICTTMERQVENLMIDITTTSSSKTTTTTTKSETTENLTTTSSSSKPPLNVIVARKLEDQHNESIVNVVDDEIFLDAVMKHVHDVNDIWFQQTHPLLTRQRTKQLQDSFSNANAKVLDLKQAFQVLFTDAEREHLTYENFLDDWNAFLLLKQKKQQKQNKHDVGKTSGGSHDDDDDNNNDENSSSNNNNNDDDSSYDTTHISFDVALEFLNEMQ